MHLAVVQFSPGLMWTTSVLFFMYLRSVTVCAKIYRSIDKVVLGWAGHVAVVQVSPVLMWITSILFFRYLLSVTVCCDISVV